MLLFLDIDGTILPFGSSRPYPLYEGPEGPVAAGHPLLARADPGLGGRLAALGCVLVWATTWTTEDANDLLAPWLGLPPLPTVDWPDPPPDEEGVRHWKTRSLVEWAAGRPFVWVDDEIGAVDRAWVAAHHPAPALLHRVDHRYGLTDADFMVVREWLGGGSELL
ncbi:HAD domain-containing protein [Streptomyces sp. S.PB5]|uniref:HAD domain-containing protein n=1 Tax=Streptomyces sp. S.PB5 TaxID=3020844 RepID=UPI0025B117D2|nr:HAD domain-containing protein [Streptomyces sp. S.PB5]MDN3028752.1 HAD domain-containing protein [Streptomyces sp. S.PB5]